MIAELKSYPAYKDSGTPWLGDVPGHWQIAPAFAAYTPKLVKNTGMIERTVLSLSYGRIIVKPAERLHGLVPESFETYQIVDPGNIVVRTTDLQNDRTSLRVGIAQRRGIITSAYMCLQVDDSLSPDFGYLLLNAYDLLKVLYGYGSGLRQNLDFAHIKRMRVLIPPASEQSAIVRFLDYVDRRIRRYIGAKQTLIKLLEEKKQAIIHYAVTRGLDPNVRLKPSGVKRLGNVPEYWDVKQLGRFITLQRGFDITKEQQSEGSVPVVSSGGISSYHSHSTSRGPGVIVGRKGSVGTVHFVEGAHWAHDTTLWVKEFNTNHPRFVYYVLLDLDLKQFDTGSSNPTVNRNIIHPEIVSFPPLDEQRKIAKFLDHSLERTGRMINEALSEISLLREYRTRLIADVVTGKLDVREAAANLPEEAEEVEPVEDAALLAESYEGSKGVELETSAEDAIS